MQNASRVEFALPLRTSQLTDHIAIQYIQFAVEGWVRTRSLLTDEYYANQASKIMCQWSQPTETASHGSIVAEAKRTGWVG